MSTADNFEVGSNAIINQTNVEDVKKIIKDHGSPELTIMFEALVNHYENPNSRLCQNCTLASENWKVVSEVSLRC